ncbi:MAG: 50S ribosomal protein L19e [Candidatus Aenigmarchaeota archaeon]|nr:50S ribosomal protein L19e [Candidatus Aenigmarchaeota archaeon]
MAGLRSQRTIAARLIGCGETRIRFDPLRTADIADAITAADVKTLINDGVIFVLPKKGNSNARIKKNLLQKKKGRKQGKGSKKGKRSGLKKRAWITRIRSIRSELNKLQEENRIEKKTYRRMYNISKSGFFRSRNHLLVHLERIGLLKEAKAKK